MTERQGGVLSICNLGARDPNLSRGCNCRSSSKMLYDADSPPQPLVNTLQRGLFRQETLTLV
jgi:hypothetical protein